MGRCPCCRMQLTVSLEFLGLPGVVLVSPGSLMKLLHGAWLKFISWRAEGKVFRAEIVEQMCMTFCPACRRPLTAVLGPKPVAAVPAKRLRRSKLVFLGQSQRRWRVNFGKHQRQKSSKQQARIC